MSVRTVERRATVTLEAAIIDSVRIVERGCSYNRIFKKGEIDMPAFLHKHHDSDWMTYNQFVTWCNERAADGCWGLLVSVLCLDIIREVKEVPFYKRKKAWNRINENNRVYYEIVKPTNEKIEEFFSQEDM